ncbi:conjugal transfer protein TraB [Rhizobium sp. IBUN]|uniref:conjugal transfer protein TraB n=1 Tax=Rhizobium sp. IBUN TaxID=1042326 RepID=UPI0003FCA835|nr:conjugal transfer protein TraB [Rhizobium sp. IBUN]
MRRELVRNSVLLGAALAAGWIGWCGNPLALPVSAAFPFIWSVARNRPSAAMASATYFLAASRGLPHGAVAFYGSNLLSGLLLWLIASAAFVSVHAVLWTERSGWRLAIRYLLVMFLMAVPPFGILGWAHPITAAGVLFPGWGWVGVGTMAAGLLIMTTRLRPAAAIAIIGLWLWSAAQWTTQHLPSSWYGVELTLGASLGRTSNLERQRGLVATARAARRGKGAVVVLPESAIGFWTPTVERLWLRELRASGLTVVAGASVVDEIGYDNVLLELSEFGARIIYRERMPVPGSMWQPWQSLIDGGGGARAYFFSNPVAEIAGKRVAPVICYEQLIVWPVVQSMLYDPDIIVAVGNGWWTGSTSIVPIQRASVEAWSRLFHKPLVFSVNT